MKRYWCVYVLTALAVALPFAASAQTVTATLPAGSKPQAIAVNPVTNKIYVANKDSNNVTVVDGATNTTTTVAAGMSPNSVAVNPITNKIYVANNGSANVTVIDGVTNNTTTVAAGTGPYAVAVNPVTNKIYIANYTSNNVTVIDGATNTATTIGAGSSPYALAVNAVTNKIYVANSNGSNVTVIDGASNSTATVAAGTYPIAVAVNPVTNKIFITNYGGQPTGNSVVTVIDGATNSATSVPVGRNPYMAAVNPVTNKIYVANGGDAGSFNGSLTVIDGATNAATNPTSGGNVFLVCVNTITNQIYIGYQGLAINSSVSAIDGATGVPTGNLSVGASISSLAVNPVTNRIYAASSGTSNNITVIDGDTYLAGSPFPVGDGYNLSVAAVNPVTNKIYANSPYIGNPDSGVSSAAFAIYVIDPVAGTSTQLPLSFVPSSIVVNPITNKIYASGGNDVIVIDGATNTSSLLSSAGGILALNTVANRIYALTGSGLDVIDGATGAITIVPVPSFPIPAIAVNEVTDKIFITNYNDPGSVTVVDGNTNTTSTVAVGKYPVAVAVNSVTNKIYVVSGDDTSTLTVIDGVTYTTSTVAAGATAESVAVNPFTNRIYVSNYNSGNLLIFDGATLNATTLTVGNQALQVLVNPVTNQVYINSVNPSVLDGATNFLSELPSLYLAPNLVANQVYISVSPNGYPNLAVVNEQQVQPQPLNTAITPLPANRTTNPNPTFTFTASTTTSVQPNAVFYQLDTWQGTWTSATGHDPTFSATLSNLPFGVHTLYAYAADGGEANPTQPLIGAIQPYQFVYSPPLLPQTISFPAIPPQLDGTTFSLTASASSGLPVTFVASSPQVCQLAGGAVYFLSAGTCVVTASQSGSPLYSPAPSVTQNISITGVAMSGTPLISSQVPGRLRNDYSGFIGFTFTVGAAPIQVSWLGRFIAPGNTLTHVVKLVQANGVDLPGGSVTVATLNAVVGQYQYAPLATPISLSPNTTYYLVSQEGSSDQFHDLGPVSSAASVASIVGPVYTDGNNNYITYSQGYAGESYVPLNFLYGPGAASPISASITSPSAGATLTGSASIVVSTTGAVTALQLQVDGLNRGASVPVSQSSPYTLKLDTTQLTNGTHSLTVIAADAQADNASSPAVSVTVANTTVNSIAFVTSQSLTSLRNNYSGFVGMAITVANAPVAVSSLGRFVVSGNSNTHLLKLVQTNGVDVAGGSVSLPLSSAFAGAYQYAALASPVTLAANTTYYLVSQETNGGDQWYDLSPITSTSVASVAGPVYLDGKNVYHEIGFLAGECYVPLSFLYGTATTSALSDTITSPQSGATLSGKTVPVTVTTTGSAASLQLQVDGTNQGIPVVTSPLTLDTTVLTNGQHTLTVVVAGAGSNTAVSPGVSVTVNNSAVSTTTFITSQTPSSPRNNYSGFVGMAIQVANTPVVVSSLGRFVAPGDSQSHLLKLVQSNGIDLPGGSVSASLAGASAGSYQYAALAASVTLAANTKYYLVSQETAGGDQWYDYGPVNSTSAANVLGPVYSDAGGNYITGAGAVGYSYVPLNLLYGGTTASTLSATITSPQSGATLSGKTVPVTVTSTGGAASLQLQVDGTNQGIPVVTSPLTLDTTVLTNGQHTLTVVVAGAGSNTAVSPGVSVTVNNSAVSTTTFITSQTPSSPRNNYSGFVGMAIQVANTPVVVSSLGRFVAPGDSQSHLLKLVQSNGIDLPGGSVSASLAGASAGSYQYAALAASVTLAANTKYYLVSQETAGGDQWYDYGPVNSTSVANVLGPVYSDAGGNYITGAGAVGYSYVPLNLLYGGTTASTLSATITSPQSGATLSGKTVPVTVTSTGGVTSLQLQVDGINQGGSVSASPLTLDTTVLGNGQHTLTVVVTGASSNTAVSPGVSVTVNNGGAAATAFITSQTPSSPRNNYTGFVGTAITVGASPLTVTQLGRLMLSGDTGTHLLKLVQGSGADVPGGSATVSLAGATAETYVYAALSSPITLAANTGYYLVSQETAGGDSWYDLEPVTSTAAAKITGATYSDAHGNYVVVGGLPNYSYVTVNFQYQ